MEVIPGLLAVVRLRDRKDLYAVVAENPSLRRVDRSSITGKYHIMRGVPFQEILEVVEGSS
jgi:hypothetical protein